MNHEDHDDREEHDERHPFWRRYQMRLSSPLAPEAEEVMTETIGSAIAVHRALGPGFLESIYKKAMRIELEARNIAYECERLVGIYYPPLLVRELRELCRSRQALVHTRTALIQRLRAVLLRHGITDARQRLTRRGGLAWVDTLVLPAQAAASVQRLRRLIVAVLEETSQVDAMVTQTASRDPIVAQLVTLTGIGAVLGLTIRAEIGDITRFATPRQLASYAGVVPRVDASAGRAHYGRITKTGSPWLRWALVEAAMHGTRRSDSRGRWARRLAMRKGALKARVAIARTLCDEIWRMWPRST